jgi:hypothetical protein
VKLKLTIASILALLLIGVGTAEAFQWHMRYGQAKNASKSFVKELCAEDSECTAWGVGQCYRQSESSFSCQIGWFYADYPRSAKKWSAMRSCIGASATPAIWR